MSPRLRTLARITAVTWTTDPVRAGATAALTAIQHASPALAALGMRDLVGAAGGHGHAVRGGLLVLLTVVVNQVAGFAGFVLRTGLTERVTQRLEADLVRLVSGRPEIDHLEDPATLDRITLLRDSTGSLAGLTDSLLTAIGVVARLTVALLLLAAVDARLLALAACGTPALAAGLLGERIQDRRDAERATPMRRAAVLHHLTRTPGPAAELRLADATTAVAGRVREDRRLIDVIINRSNVAMAGLGTAADLAYAAGLLLALLVVTDRAAARTIDAGDVALVLTIAVQLNGQITAMADWFTGLLDMLRAAGHHRWLTDLADTRPRQATPPASPCDIDLDDVSFVYPGADRPALHGVTLTLRAGTSVAVVGENGSGKTTLVKLLTGMCHPATGTIRIGDHDLADVDPRAWRLQLSAAFQDAAAFEVTVQRAVGLGDLPRLDDRRAVRTAVEEAGASPMVDALPDGLDTALGRSFDHGVELSGGQWQRLAVARAGIRHQPRLLILDEPSANLDPAAEHELFLRLLTLGGGGATTTVFVTHRLSTAAHADHIVVLADGRLVEQGTHVELRAAGGHYADLYRLQSDGYR